VSFSLGLSLGRRRAAFTLLEVTSKITRIIQHGSVPCVPGDLEKTLRPLLSLVREPLKKAPLTLLLSPQDAACTESWKEDHAFSPTTLARLGPALCEARSAGESVEELAVHLIQAGGSVRSIAVRREVVQSLRKAAEGFNLVSVSSIPAALAAVFPRGAFTTGGERFEIGDGLWRAFPTDGADDPGTYQWQGTDVPFPLAAAFAGAVADPDLLPNALQGTPEGRPTFLRRFAQPLVAIGAAATLVIAALALRFHHEAERARTEMGAVRRAERALWDKTLPMDPPQEGGLLRTLKRRLADLGETPGVSDSPSALSFWVEIARQMPDAESTGITLESLDLAPDGGRLSARFAAAKEDPLKNAAQLEGKLNGSERLKARGDYEVREGQVQVRLRMDYKP
jgi:hypothetical protein